MKNKPRIRFKGFTEDWEQRKLGDIATFSKGNGYSKSDLAPSGNPIILYGRLYTNYETTISNVDTFVELKDKSVLSQGGEVIVPASGETAEDISRASVVKNQGIIIGGDLNVIKANHLLDPTFLALTISNGGQQKELSKRAQGKSVVHLHNSDLQEVNLIFPLLNEQKEISTLFEKMDNIITLHQRKLEKLKLAKKALLQKLFPKNGSKFPELRFKGFANAWEQRKLGDYLSIPEKEILEVDSSDDLITVKLNLGGVELGASRDTLSLGSTVYYKRYAGQFIYGKQNFFNGSMGLIPTNLDGKGSSGDVPSFNISNIEENYLYTYVSRESYWRSKVAAASGTGSKRIHEKTFLDFNIDVPSMDEQKLISNTFDLVDRFITLHQRKLDKLQEVKKGLLQKMFV